MSGPMKIRGIQYFVFHYKIFSLWQVIKIEKGYCRSTRGTVAVCLGLKPPISLFCRNCEPHHFHLNLDDE